VTRVLRALWVLALLAFGGLSVASYRARIDPVAHERFTHALRALKALDAELNGAVMQSRQALVTHYDDIVRTTRAMRATFLELQTVPRFLGEREQAAIHQRVSAASSAFGDKERAIEVFKSENAVLRNSVRYFPTGAHSLRDQLEAMEGEDAARMARRMNELLRSVLHYNQLPGEDLEARARQALSDLESSAPVPVAMRDAGVVARHAEIVLDRRDRVDAQTKAIFQLPTRSTLDELDAHYSSVYQASLHASDRRRVALFLVAIAVLALVSADIITHLRRVAASERLASEKLASANLALLREKEREKELSDLKSRFVSMTSHEFRTPLSVMLSSAELLEAYSERWSASKRADHFRRIKAAVRGMTDLLDGILVIGKADAGRLTCAPAPVDVTRFCSEIAETIQPSLGPAHTWEASVEGDFEGVWLDEKLLNHILTNLLSNAVKYSPAGGTIRFAVSIDDDDIVFEVSDTGIGIAADDRGRLFESFHRGKNVGDIPGTGLGLAVVKRAVDAHGGGLEMESSLGEGARFVVRLPLARRAAPATEDAGQRPASSREAPEPGSAA
jgi:signal transduction histidine kinase